MSGTVAKGQEVIDGLFQAQAGRGEWASDSLFAEDGLLVTSITNSCSAQARITTC
jgi:hypothetical protein